MLVGLYGGYFGAGIGILMLAALSLLGHTDIHRTGAARRAGPKTVQRLIVAIGFGMAAALMLRP